MLLVVRNILYTVIYCIVSVTLYKWKVYLIMPNQLALFAVRQFDYFISRYKVEGELSMENTFLVHGLARHWNATDKKLHLF